MSYKFDLMIRLAGQANHSPRGKWAETLQAKKNLEDALVPGWTVEGAMIEERAIRAGWRAAK